MCKKNYIKISMLMIFISLFVVLPKDIVWGGNQFQTVPTLDPAKVTKTPKSIIEPGIIITNTPAIEIYFDALPLNSASNPNNNSLPEPINEKNNPTWLLILLPVLIIGGMGTYYYLKRGGINQ